MAQGRFITFEGGEGAGKSTQARLLADRLQKAGMDVLVTREPGGSPFAEAVRQLILDPKTPPHSALAEALLFYAARTDHLEKIIRPALASGRWVICDRFSDSTLVYQTTAGGLAVEAFKILEALVVGPTKPNLTLILDAPAKTGLERVRQRGGSATLPALSDAYEARDLSFHNRLRDGFVALAKSEPRRCVLIDANRSIDDIAADVWAAVETRLISKKAAP